jgi:acetylornithine deacetylase/succinyl-diaminopimelate desuccinylase-like protein
MEASHPLVQVAEEAYEAQFGQKAEVGVWRFSTNGVSTKGIHGIPSIGFGPAPEEYAHTPKDQVKVDDLVQAAAFYGAFIKKIGDRHDFLGE